METPRFDLGDCPIEFDCERCGARHVIDPEVVRAIVSSRWFRCSVCRRWRWTRRSLAAVGMMGDLAAGVCVRCDDPRASEVAKVRL